MKRIILLKGCILLASTAFYSCSQKDAAVSKSDIKSMRDSVSYAYGYLMGMQSRNQGQLDIDSRIFAAAFRQGYDNDTDALFKQAECADILDNYARTKQEGVDNNVKEKAVKNIAQAEKFLKDNQTKDGIKQTESGLQYKVIKQGKGVKPQTNRGDRIRFRYGLSVLDGDGKIRKVQSDFDKPDSPPHLQGVDNFISGFTEAVQMMNAGSRYTVWIHPDLGYGLQDNPEIPAGSLLIFDIEVTDVLPGEGE
ncbi:MAG: FKBP-type peptidyl-prolyl cis-trans isomerase [Bacteroidales bacterium]|nr:FKBP-type peptidyl-prolyl cis-trans isomerase [Bacteroidales bacterium]